MAEKPKTVIRGQLDPGRTQATARIFIASPSYGSSFSGEYVRSLFMLLSSRPRRPVEYLFAYFDYSDIVISRNYLVSQFYFQYPDYSHILFIDDDTGYDPALISEMLDLGEPVVGTIYPKRYVDLRKLHAAKGLPYEKALAQSLEFVGELRKPLERRGDFVSVNYCGTGVMLISRGCIASMIEKLPNLVDRRRFKRMPFGRQFEQFLTPFDKIRTDAFELSEDLSFCRRWIDDCGGKIWAHTNRNIRHVGSLTVSSRLSDRD
jgi:hypothetical protein